MHSQAHEKTNNHLKTKHYKIGINLPQKIYEFSNTGMIVTAKNKVHSTVSWAANALYLELNMLQSAHQKQNSYIPLDLSGFRKSSESVEIPSR